MKFASSQTKIQTNPEMIPNLCAADTKLGTQTRKKRSHVGEIKKMVLSM